MRIKPKKKPSRPLIDKLEADLRQEFPHLKIERFDTAIRILQNTESGFAVGLVEDRRKTIPVLGSWVEFGMGREEAVALFQAALRGQARLIEISRKGIAYRWRVEALRDGVWRKENKEYSAYLIFPNPLLLFWRKKERVLWNDPGRLHEP
jgi:hypothetical protein